MKFHIKTVSVEVSLNSELQVINRNQIKRKTGRSSVSSHTSVTSWDKTNEKGWAQRIAQRKEEWRTKFLWTNLGNHYLHSFVIISSIHPSISDFTGLNKNQLFYMWNIIHFLKMQLIVMFVKTICYIQKIQQIKYQLNTVLVKSCSSDVKNYKI